MYQSVKIIVIIIRISNNTKTVDLSVRVGEELIDFQSPYNCDSTSLWLLVTTAGVNNVAKLIAFSFHHTA